MLPEYFIRNFCNMKTIEFCDFYMHKDCKETCGYALDIKGKKLNDNLVNVLEDLTNGDNGDEKLKGGII